MSTGENLSTTVHAPAQVPEATTASAPPAAPSSAMRPTPRGIPRVVWPIAALVVLLLFNLIADSHYFHIGIRDGRLNGSLIDILKNVAPVMLLSMGMTLVIATGGIDLSVGAVMAICGATAARLIVGGEPLIVVLGVSLSLAIIAGVWNGLLVVLLDLQPIIATLILMVAGRGIAQLIAEGQIVTFEGKNAGFVFLARGSFLGLPFPVTIVAIVAIVTGILSRGTALGLFVESVGNNPTASRFAGVPGRLVKVLCYTVCGALAGVAGWVATADIQGADANNVGLNLELDAILAVSLGGTALTGGRFSLIGSLIGALFIQTLTSTILTRGVPPAMTLVLKGLIVLAVCLLQSPVFRSKLQRALKGGAR